jgi:hypothetical protein
MVQIVGSLKARNYAMIVSNFAPRTTLTFNVHASPTPAKPWGTWTVNRQPDQPPNRGSSSSKAKPEIGPRADDTQFRYTAKVSKVSGSPRYVCGVQISLSRKTDGTDQGRSAVGQT